MYGDKIFILDEINSENCAFLIGDLTTFVLNEQNQGKSLSIIINSPGGEALTLFTILGLLNTARLHDITISTFVLGTAASAASLFAACGDKRYISKYHPVDKSLSWIPAVMIENKYYISPEPIDSELRLYKDNPNVIQIVGIVDKGVLYSRENIPTKYPDLIRQTGLYRLRHVDAGYYDGFIFSGNQVNAEALSDYLQYLDVFKVDPITNLPGGDNGELGWVKSEFIEITVNGVATGDYYWQGQASDIVRLPDTRDECKTYLNVIAFKSLPDEVQQ